MAEVEMTEDEFEDRLLESSEVGKEQGLLHASSLLSTLAAGAFLNGKDERARDLRELSADLKRLAQGHRATVTALQQKRKA
jgi:hypothetical protein